MRKVDAPDRFGYALAIGSLVLLKWRFVTMGLIARGLAGTRCVDPS